VYPLHRGHPRPFVPIQAKDILIGGVPVAAIQTPVLEFAPNDSRVEKLQEKLTRAPTGRAIVIHPLKVVVIIAFVLVGCASLAEQSVREVTLDEWGRLRASLIRILPASGIWREPLPDRVTLFSGCPATVYVTGERHIDIAGGPGGAWAPGLRICDFSLMVISKTRRSLPTPTRSTFSNAWRPRSAAAAPWLIWRVGRPRSHGRHKRTPCQPVGLRR
jgi:hypothetical protein